MQNLSQLVIETQHLNFGFKKSDLTLKDISLQIEKGAIYGFLGPNGAGKTTTIRLLLGLLTPVDGSVKIFGTSLAKDSKEIFAKVGALIENPSLYEHLTGIDNLEVTAKLKNVPKKRIHEVLEIVKLTGSEKMKVRQYSLGMKQRLGLALALLSEPELLILDEPTNGLDPQGMIETRELLYQLNKELGVTILISSHLLSEIEKLVTHLGIIKKGELVFQGTIKELQNLKRGQSVIRIETSNNAKAYTLLNNLYKINFNEETHLEIIFQSREQVSHICKTLVLEGIDVYDFNITSNDLENIFLSITNNYHVSNS